MLQRSRVMRRFTDLFKRTPVDVVLSEQLSLARSCLVEHEAAAEHHAALSEMYRKRVLRLVGSTFEGGDEPSTMPATSHRLHA
jgi:hypothetical protein